MRLPPFIDAIQRAPDPPLMMRNNEARRRRRSREASQRALTSLLPVACSLLLHMCPDQLLSFGIHITTYTLSRRQMLLGFCYSRVQCSDDDQVKPMEFLRLHSYHLAFLQMFLNSLFENPNFYKNSPF